MSHWNLRSFPRYLPQMKSISEKVDEFHIAYVEGEPEEAWKQLFSFHKIDMQHRFVKSKIVRFFLLRKKIYSQLKDVDIDVIFTLSDLWMQEFSKYCSSKKGVPYVVWLRGNHREVRKAAKINPIKEKALNYLETRNLKEANLVIPNSRDLAKKAEGWGVQKGKITLPVYSGVDTRTFKPMNVKRSREFTVAYAGRISPEKRVPYLLRIAERLNSIHFIIAGGKEMDISFPSSIDYVGALPFSEMPTFYNKADLIVLPSVTEGFPSVILEAYACGKPVLASKEAFPDELKIFGSVADISEFETEIKRLKTLDLKTLGREARKYVEKNYTWDKFGQSIIELLKSVVD